jgi:hypothetical protein
VYRRSLVRPHGVEAIYYRRWNLARVRPARTPPSTFLFLPIHLSNSPGLATPSPWTRQRACEAAATDVQSVTNHRKSEELRRRAFPPSGGAPCVGYICSTARYCQPGILEFFIRSSSTTARVLGAGSRAPYAVAIADLQSPAFNRWSSLVPARIRDAAL